MGINVETAEYKIAGKFQDDISAKSKKAFDQFKRNSEIALKAFAVAMTGATIALGAFIKSTLDSFDKIGKFADRIDISTGKLQELRFAFDKAGVGVETVDSALLKFGKNLGEGRAGFGTLVENLKRIDEQLSRDVLAAGSMDQALDIIFQAMGRADTQAERLAISTAAFGKAGALMTAAFVDGGAAFQQWIVKAREMGLIIDEKLIRSAEALNDQMSTLGTAFKVNFQVGLINPFIDEFGKFVEDVNSSGFQDGIRLIGSVLGEFIKFIVLNANQIAVASASLAALFFVIKLGSALGLKSSIIGITAVIAAALAGVVVFNELAEARDNALKDDAKMTFLNPRIEGSGISTVSEDMEGVQKATELVQTQFFKFTTEDIPNVETTHRGMIDALNGGLTAYAAQAGDTFDAVRSLTDRTFRGMEDALVEFVKTGKIEFADFIDTLISDLIRFQIQQSVTLPLARGISGFFGSFGGIQGTSPEALEFSGLSSNLLNSGVPDIGGAASGAGLNFGFPGFASGIDRVPRDMLAMIHKDETVLNRRDADAFRRGGGGVTVNQTIVVQPGISQTVRAEMINLLPAFRREAIAGVIDAQNRNKLGGGFG